MEYNHRPVLLKETMDAIALKPNGVYIDGTVGGGGHSEAIAERLDDGFLLSIDRDPDAVSAASERLKRFPQVKVVRGNFSDMDAIAYENGIKSADGILLDIGVSSFQLDSPDRGFSYRNDAPLDMRMSKEGTTAADLVNNLSQSELAAIIREYGEDANAGRIAAGIVRAREKKPILTTGELTEVIKASLPAAVKREEGHPARKTFQALRIAVNGELEALEKGLESAFGLLKPGGRLLVITFHSLEDRIVKQRMADWAQGCICPKDFPVCVCGRKPRARIIYKRGVTPSEEELTENPRARSARLRVAERLVAEF